jgi:hypothetical protein
MLDRRKLLWWAFWFVFLSTPVCAVFFPSALPRIPMPRIVPTMPFLLCIASMVTGAFAAGLILAKLTSKMDGEFVRRGITYGSAISAFYAVIAFAGCLFAVMP